MRIYYIGSFPPVYGGVTIKNKYLFDALSQETDIRRIDMNRVKRGNIRELLRLAWALLTGKQFVIGLAGQKNRRVFTKFLYALKRKAMARSVLIVMGGIVSDILDAGPGFVHKMQTYLQVFVEFPGMAQKLAAGGLTNVSVYPNGRPRPDRLIPISAGANTLQCVFFSQIQPEKGVDLILQAAAQLPDIQFHFYGRIVPSYRDEFLQTINQSANLAYHGLFTGSSESVYAELNQYDILLLPTRCETEGLPGILIESKIAGIPCLVSDKNYLREVIQNGTDGFLLEPYSAECLANALKALNSSREQLQHMKQESRNSAERYLIDVCVKDVLTALQGG